MYNRTLKMFKLHACQTRQNVIFLATGLGFPLETFRNFHNLYFFIFILGKSKEAEIKRINKELANIRSKFKGDKTLDGYQKKKYVCKLLFIFLLGHDIDFGHMEAVNLLSSNKYSEKQIVRTILYKTRLPLL